MKKLLKATLLLSLCFISGETMSCSKKIIENYEESYGYQTIPGPSKGSQLKSSSTTNKSLDYFFGKTQFNYAYYKKNKNSYVFSGNEENVKKTLTQNRDVTLTNDQEQSEQIVLFKNNDKDNITDISISFTSDDDTKSLIDSVSFIKPIKTTTKKIGVLSHVEKGDFVTFDEIDGNKLNTMKYDFQPILVTYKNSYDKQFTNNSTISISYKCNGQDEKFNVKKKIKSKKTTESNNSNFSTATMFYFDQNEKFILKELDKIITNKNIDISTDLYNNIKSSSKLDVNLKKSILSIVKKSNLTMPSEFTLDDNYTLDENQNIIVTIKSEQYRDITGKHTISVTLQNNNLNDENNIIVKNNLLQITSGITEEQIKSTNSFRIDSDDKNINLNNKVDKTLSKMNSDIKFDATDISSIVPVLKMNNASNSFDEYLNLLFNNNDQTIENVFDNLINDNNEFTLDYNLFDRQVKYLITKGNIKNIFIDSIGRGSKSFSLYIENTNESDKNNKYYKLTIMDELIRSKTKPAGELTEAGEQFAKLYLPKLFTNLSDHINNNYSNMDVTFYASLDELSNDIAKMYRNILDSIDNTPIKLHSYAGWQFTIDDDLNEEQLEEQLDSIDYITIQIRYIIKSYDSSEKSKKILSNYFDHRTAKGLQTHLYSTWNDYPGGYIGCDGYELSYGPLLAKSLHATGYNRFEAEWYRSDYSLEGEVKDCPYEAGDDFLIYNGDTEKFNYSLRYVNFSEGFDMVDRINELSNFDLLTFINYNYISDWTEDNIDSKWNFDSEISDKTIAGQEEIIRNKLGII